MTKRRTTLSDQQTDGYVEKRDERDDDNDDENHDHDHDFGQPTQQKKKL